VSKEKGCMVAGLLVWVAAVDEGGDRGAEPDLRIVQHFSPAFHAL
jgi:hypothetical protein